jgi:hypothetical protein
MGSSRPRNSTRAAQARSSKRRTNPLHSAARKRPVAKRKPVNTKTAPVDSLRETPDAGEDTAGQREPDQSEELMAILDVHVHALCLTKTAIHGLERAGEDAPWDEIKTLQTAVTMLRRVDSAINDVAEGRPSPIRPEEMEQDDYADEEDLP